MTTSTCWPPIGPATYRTTTQEDQVRREANTQVDEHLNASAQVVESAPRTLSRWRHGFEPRWDYKRKTPGQGLPKRDLSLCVGNELMRSYARRMSSRYVAMCLHSLRSPMGTSGAGSSFSANANRSALLFDLTPALGDQFRRGRHASEIDPLARCPLSKAEFSAAGLKYLA